MLVLEAGATFTGPFVLPRKSGTEWIIVESSALKQLPPAGVRVSPSNSRLMPVLESAAGNVLASEPGAHHYRFIGLEIRPRSGAFLNNLVQLGADERSIDQLPHDIVFERCYLHGDPQRGSRRGIAMNSRSTSVTDSYLADFKEAGADSQAIASWNGRGPFSIVNSYLEAAGENVMFGGADPSIQSLTPTDIEIRRNHFYKPLSWKIGDRTYAGTAWTVKNLLELKNARHVLVDGNLFENNWPQAQNGFAILFTVRNQDGASPWSTVEGVTFTNNLIRHVGAGINILGHDDLHPSGPTRRVLISNNLFYDIGGGWGNGRLFQLLDGTTNVVIEHNSALNTESFVVADGNAPHTGFVFRNNIVQHQQYGLIGSGSQPGLPSLKRYFTDAVMVGNAIVGGDANRYPPGNFFPKSLEEVGFVDPGAGNYRLSKSSRLRKAGTDGRDVGVDFDAVAAEQNSSASPGALLQNRAALASTLGVAGPPLSLGLRVALASGRSVALPIVFWISLLLLAYASIGYPLAVAGWAAFRPRPYRREPIEPSVSVVIAVHNEVAHIGRKIANLLKLNYPPDRLEILVGSDGSTDGTLERLRAISEQHIRIFVLPERQGKPAVLNTLVPKARGEIVVLADVRQQFDPQVLRRLVQPFADPKVGAVSGELVLTQNPSGSTVGDGTGVYWRYEKFIRSRESRIDSTVGATGAIYAIRRTLFEAIPEDTILDDVLIPLRIVRHGYRILFEPRALVCDLPPTTAHQEFTRKVRTLAGNFQLFSRERWLLSPAQNRLWWQTVSHKALRLLIPLLQLAAFAANMVLAQSSAFYQLTLVVQILFYVGAVAGCVLQHCRKRFWPATFPYIFCLLSWATVVGFIRCITGRQTVTWEKAASPTIV
jgi:cellulose synthase/poly-beta-1,6-N-acetylglucosamine synthase-like glycosyltransferase